MAATSSEKESASCPQRTSLPREDRAATDAEIGKDCCVRADRGPRPHDRSQHLPIGFALEGAFWGRGARVKVVDELHAVANKDLIFDLYAFTNEAVR